MHYLLIHSCYEGSLLRISAWSVPPFFFYSPLGQSFTTKYFVFSNSFHFLRTPLCELVCYTLHYQVIFVSVISQSLLNRYQCNLYYRLSYTCCTNTAIFRLILLVNIAPEYTVHRRVKGSITRSLFCLQGRQIRM